MKQPIAYWCKYCSFKGSNFKATYCAQCGKDIDLPRETREEREKRRIKEELKQMEIDREGYYIMAKKLLSEDSNEIREDAYYEQ